MKTTTLVCTALAASMAFATVAQAQPQHEWRGDRGHAQQQQQWRGHDRGQQHWQHQRQAPAQHWQHEHHSAPRYYGGHAYNNYAPRPYVYGGYYGAPRPYYGPSYYVGGYAPAYVAQRYWVNDWRARHLYAPPYGYQWVQTDAGDVLLVALATGLIANAILAAH
jgi:Ni/Co efflux regulator RcnB